MTTLEMILVFICAALLFYLFMTRLEMRRVTTEEAQLAIDEKVAAAVAAHMATRQPAPVEHVEEGGEPVEPVEHVEGAPPYARRLPINERYTPPPVAPLHVARPTTSVLTRVWFDVAQWLVSARAMHPQADPLLTAEQTRELRVMQQALVEHGQLIEAAIREATKQSPDLTAWAEPQFAVSYMATHAQKAGTAEGCERASLPYGDGTENHRSIQVDLITFDHRSNVIRAYEIKRKSSPAQWSDANLKIVQMLLLDYARSKTINGVRLDPVKAETFLICYYGEPNGGNKITRGELDRHFGAPVVEHVEAATAKFRGELQALIAAPAPVEEREAA